MNFNEIIKTLVVFALGTVEPAGWLIAGVTQLLWPDSQTDVWGQIKNQVEALIGQQIEQEVYQLVQQDLIGLSNVLLNYQQAVEEWLENPGSPAALDGAISQYNTTVDLFVAAQPHFQATSSKLLLLPLFVQMMNLYLAVLRDGVNNSQAWRVPSALETLESTIAASQQYAGSTFNLGYNAIPESSDAVGLWQARNNYVQQMALTVMDFSFYWTYFDPTKGAPAPLTREIYSSILATSGTLGGSGITLDPLAEITSPVDRAPITALTVGGVSQVDGFKVTYGGQQDPTFGTLQQSSEAQGGGWSGSISPTNPIFQIGLYGGATLPVLWFWFLGGGASGYCGNDSQYLSPTQGDSGQVLGYPRHVLSSVSVFGWTGSSSWTGSAAFIVFGFRYQDSYPGWSGPPVCVSIGNGNATLASPVGVNSPFSVFGAGTDLTAFCDSNHHLFVCTNQGLAPTLTDITPATPNIPPVNGALACTIGLGAAVRWIAFQGWDSSAGQPDGHIYVVTQGMINQTTWSTEWTCADLWAAANCPSPCANSGPLSTFGDDTSTLVVFRGADSHIYQVSSAGSCTDLCAVTANVPLAASDPAGVFFPNLYLTAVLGAADQHVYVLAYDDFLKQWTLDDVWREAGCSVLPAPGVSLAIAGTQNTGLAIFFRGADNHIYFVCGNPGAWNRAVDLSTLNPLAPLAAGNPSAALRNGSFRVVYRGTDNLVHKIWLDTATNQWCWKNLLGGIPNAVSAASDPFCAIFDSYVTNPGSPELYDYAAEHVLYRGIDSNPYDLSGDSD